MAGTLIAGWLLVCVMVVGLCRAAKRGDVALPTHDPLALHFDARDTRLTLGELGDASAPTSVR